MPLPSCPHNDAQAMNQRPNPFDYGRPDGRPPLVARDAELRTIRRIMRTRGRLVLIGPRRFGKTSLLAAACDEVGRAGTLTLRLDAERLETPALLTSALLTAAARSLRRPVERLASILVRAAPRLRPAVTVDPATGALAVSVSATSSGAGTLALLTDALDAVDLLAAESRREVVVVLDEVQALVTDDGPGPARDLRAALHRHTHVGYVFAGSATRLLTALTTLPDGPLRGLGEVLVLGPPPEALMLAYLERTFRGSGMAADGVACRRILERADGVPYDVQRLAHAVWERVRAGEAVRVDADAVDAAVEGIVHRDDPAYTQLWTSLTPNQKKTLRAVIAMDGVRLQSAEASRRFEIPSASVQVALAALEDRHLLRRAPIDPARYRLIDPFLADWLRLGQAM
jgi:uncharacterized protein